VFRVRLRCHHRHNCGPVADLTCQDPRGRRRRWSSDSERGARGSKRRSVGDLTLTETLTHMRRSRPACTWLARALEPTGTADAGKSTWRFHFPSRFRSRRPRHLPASSAELIPPCMSTTQLLPDSAPDSLEKNRGRPGRFVRASCMHADRREGPPPVEM
jgi:hypothetical protein